MNEKKKQKHPCLDSDTLEIGGFTLTLRQLFWTILSLQVLIWSVVPILIHHLASADTVETLIQRYPFQRGYHRDSVPTSCFAHVSGVLGTVGFSIYVIQQLLLVLGVWSVKALTFELSGSARYAFVASLALLLCTACNIEVHAYDDYYVLQGLLPLSALFFYRGVRENKCASWLFSALILALATLAKCTAVLYLPLYALYLLCFPHCRKYLFSTTPYLALVLYGLMLLPCVACLHPQDLHAIRDAFLTRGLIHISIFKQYFCHNLSFFLAVLVQAFPTLLAVCVALTFPGNATSKARMSHQCVFDLGLHARVLSGLLSVGPLVLLFLFAACVGVVLHREWGGPFVAFLGTAVLTTSQPVISQRSLARFTWFIMTVMLSFGVGYIIFS